MEKQTEEILQRLKEMGKVTDEDIFRADAMVMNKGRLATVESLHALLCELDHDSNECRWYMERQIDGTWNQPVHKAWVDFAINIAVKLKTDWDGLNNLAMALSMVAPLGINSPKETMRYIGEFLCDVTLPQPQDDCTPEQTSPTHNESS